LRPGSSKRTLIAALAAAVLLLLAAAPSALAGVLFPERGGSPNADDISTLYEIVFWIGVVIFVGVEGTLVWSLVRYRARRHGPQPQQIHGNTPLEIGWTVGAAVIVVIIAAITFVFLDDIKNPPASDANGLRSVAGVQHATVNQPNPPGVPGKDWMTIHVNGQQYLWRYDYESRTPLFSYYELVVPTNTTIVLKITSQDVIHSWWIPKLGGKADAVPGHTNETWFKISKPGTYFGQCAELCGSNHADMRAIVRAVPPDEFVAWRERQARDIRAAQQALAQQRREREAAQSRQQ
jgi:cytochrome c oxidase subunit 2